MSELSEEQKTLLFTLESMLKKGIGKGLNLSQILSVMSSAVEETPEYNEQRKKEIKETIDTKFREIMVLIAIKLYVEGLKKNYENENK
jgi:hypothetical protein